MVRLKEVKQHILDLCEQLVTSNIEDVDAVDIADLARAYKQLTDAEFAEHGMTIEDEIIKLQTQNSDTEEPKEQQTCDIIPLADWIDRFNNLHKD